MKILTILNAPKRLDHPKEIEVPLKVRRFAKRAYVIPRGYVTIFQGKYYLSNTNEVMKPNNKFRYVTFVKASILQSFNISIRHSLRAILLFIKRKLF